MSSVALKAFRASLRGSSKVHRAFHKSAVPAGGGHGHSEVMLSNSKHLEFERRLQGVTASCRQ